MRMIKKLEDRYARATTCHALKGPGAHQQTGGLEEINLHLVLSDRRTAGKARSRAAPLICVTG
ncbi:hypothetical protein [Methylocystis rosea]|uniref:Uncharacterized protein n=1 Tax=Methylocystis rosea TaxID=173366 RepID=A0A3G8M404_9HYPH|nr:hypothetical protein [Methylocystis rosea]AZG75658.1 hypothetical protein EHO51_02270 [Methylocystis rosea]